MKGKIRTIMLPGKLCRKLLKYARKNKIASGKVFLTRSGTSLSRQHLHRDFRVRGGVQVLEHVLGRPHRGTRIISCDSIHDISTFLRIG